MVEESIGKRIASLRQAHGWTQQSLAGRLAMSRVAISHIEMDLSIPSERTITLLAGLFKLSPYELVDGTTYPLAKAERLPEVACCYTKLELEVLLMENDLAWLGRLAGTPHYRATAAGVLKAWTERWQAQVHDSIDEPKQARYLKARQALMQACQEK